MALIKPALLSLYALVWFASGIAHAAANQPIEQFRLDNGLEVIVLPNHRVPAVNHMIWYRVGAADDPDGKSGLAHYLEHLMFKGSPKFGAGEYTRLIDENGGNHNAFTSRDTTSYYVTIGKDKLPLVMQLEADRMKAITVNEEDAKKENAVIQEERRQVVDNSPDAQLSEQIYAALFRNHPYHNPIIGWMHEIQNLSLKDAKDFHHRNYQPANAVLIVSGDITAEELHPLAQKYYGGLERRPVAERVWKKEPPQLAARSVTLRHPHVKQPSISRSYTATSIHKSDIKHALATYVMSYLLGSGKNSVLYQTLVVEQKLASDVDTSYNLFTRGEGELKISLIPEATVELSVLEEALDAALVDFLKNGVDADSLKRTKRTMQADAIYAREGLTSMSNVMGWIITSGIPPETFNKWTTLIDSITAEDVMQAARETFKHEQSVTGYLLPLEAK